MTADDLELIRDQLARLGRIPSAGDVAEAMRGLGFLVSDAALMDTVEVLRRESVGAGPLDPLLRLPGVTDVLVNGPDQVFLDRGGGLEPAGVRFGSDEEVRKLAARLAASTGRRLDDGVPFVDARLADGTRLHAILAPVASPGTCLSLRVPAQRRFSLADWVAAGSVPKAGADLLERLVRARVAFLVSGGTGTGKTTLLAALLACVPTHERLLLVEDSRELDPAHPHCIRLEARASNAEGVGRINLTDLVRQALRMRPDRIVLGEVRGAELCDLLMAFNTGHEGGCGTVHANSAEDVPARLAALGALGGWQPEALRAQIAAALRIVIHVTRDVVGGRSRRRVAGIHLLDVTDDRVLTIPAVRFPGDGSLQPAAGCDALEELARA
ncbi:TadA family conjugal transfer-associated ATPase [Granulicoccus sp. GXG6511]|uniref:TadA family conjugal transfer-associated ATPase n=1 Tax=Granulicoccus sp. GXG6511 TaxID=3381351 RepID=UPI003D7DEBC1